MILQHDKLAELVASSPYVLNPGEIGSPDNMPRNPHGIEEEIAKAKAEEAYGQLIRELGSEEADNLINSYT